MTIKLTFPLLFINAALAGALLRIVTHGTAVMADVFDIAALPVSTTDTAATVILSQGRYMK
jgi:hypothetical protein